MSGHCMSRSRWIAHGCGCIGGRLFLLLRRRLRLPLLIGFGWIGKTTSVDDLAILIAMVENAIITCGASILLEPLAIRDVPFSTVRPL